MTIDDSVSKAIVRFIDEIDKRFDHATRDLPGSIAWDRPKFLPDSEFTSIDDKVFKEALEKAQSLFRGCVLAKLFDCMHKGDVR